MTPPKVCSMAVDSAGGPVPVHRWRRAALVPVVVLLVAVACLVAGCGDDGSVSQADLEARLQEREALSPEEATCVADYVVAGYGDAELEVVYEDGIDQLPSVLWGEYVQAVLACTLTDDLEARLGSGGS